MPDCTNLVLRCEALLDTSMFAECLLLVLRSLSSICKLTFSLLVVSMCFVHIVCSFLI